MLCRKSSVSGDHGSVRVYLNVYDLTPINGYAYWFGLGAYHSGVEVHGVEYAFGAHDYSSTGIFEGEPKQCDGFTFRKSILIGWTNKTYQEVITFMEDFSYKYRGDAYNLVSRNCNHFCDDVCIKLTGSPIPNWINRLARIGVLCKCFIPAKFNLTKVADDKMEDKVSEGEKKKRKPRRRSKKSSNSSSNSSSPTPAPEALLEAKPLCPS